MTRLLYSILLFLLSPLILLYLYKVRGKKNAGYKSHFKERFGKPSVSITQPVVIHCASVGEVLAAAPMIQALKKAQPEISLLVTCNTPTGRAQIEKSLGPSVACCYLPIDFAFAARRFINIVKPKALIVLETELWPNLFHYAQKAQCPVLVVNARLSPKSFTGYKKVSKLTQVIMNNITALSSHSQDDAERFIQLGLAKNKVSVTGSIKFDIHTDEKTKSEVEQLKASFGHRPIWVAGSTHPTEHDYILEAHKKLLEDFPSALLIIAPRHPEQFSVCEALIKERSFSYIKRSVQQPIDNTEVILADTLGELKMLYGCGQIAYIGGSLIERGGHNPLEAAAFSVGTITGPHTFNFAHIYPQLRQMNASVMVDNKDALYLQVKRFLEQPQEMTSLGINAQQCLEQNQGAINKTVMLITQMIGEVK